MPDAIPTCPRCQSQDDITQHAIRHSLMRRQVSQQDGDVHTSEEEEIHGEDQDVYFWCEACNQEVPEEPEEEPTNDGPDHDGP